MLGYSVTLSRQQPDDRLTPARWDSVKSDHILYYQADSSVVRWFENLVPSDAVVDLGGNGYPYRVTVRADAILPAIRSGLQPEVDSRGIVKDDVLDACDDNEWLIVEFWDQS